MSRGEPRVRAVGDRVRPDGSVASTGDGGTGSGSALSPCSCARYVVSLPPYQSPGEGFACRWASPRWPRARFPSAARDSAWFRACPCQGAMHGPIVDEAMTEQPNGTGTKDRVRVLPESELLDDLEGRSKALEKAETFGWRARRAGEELEKMGPVLSALGERIRRLGVDVREAVAFLDGRSYYEVTLSKEPVLAYSEDNAIVKVGEQAACGVSDVETEIERLPWTPEE